MFWKILIALLGVSIAAYFIPTPQELQNKFKSGQNYFVIRDYNKAIKEYNEILNTDNSFLTEDSVKVSLMNNEYIVGVITASYYQRANAHKNMKEYDMAFLDFRTVVENRFDSPSLSALAQYQIYDLYYSLGKYDSAILGSKNFIKKFPLNEKIDRALYDIGWSYREIKQYDSSNIYFRALVGRFDSSNYRAKALFQMAQNYFDQKKWQESKMIFLELVEKYNPSGFNKKEFENVELKSVKERRIFEATGTKESDETNLQLVAKSEVRIGDCYEKMDNYEKSMETYRKIVYNYYLIPSLIEMVYIKMAEMTIRLKNIEDGIYIYKKAIDDNFQNKELQAKLQYKIAQTYQEKKEYNKSSDEYNFYARSFSTVADKINFPVESAKYMGIVMRYNAKSLEKTLTEITDFQAKYPNSEYNADILMLKGLSLRELKKYDEARKVFAEIQEKYKNSNQILASKIQYAKSYFDERKWQEARASYKSIYNQDTNKTDKNELLYYIGMSDYYLEKYDSSIINLNKIEINSLYYPLSVGRISKSYIALKKNQEGLEYLSGIQKQISKDSAGLLPTIHFALGDVYTAAEKYDSALHHFNSVVIDSNNITENIKLQARYARGSLFFQLTRYEEAAKDFDYCLKNETYQKIMVNLIPSTNEKYALALVELGKGKEAVKVLDDKINSKIDEGEKIRYQSSLSEVHFRLKDYEKSIKISDDIIKRDSIEENIKLKAYVTAANAYAAQGNIEKAKTYLTDASEKYPNSPYIQEVIYQFAMLHFTNQDFKNANDLLGNYIIKYPKSPLLPQATFYKGASYYKMGKFDEATKFFQKFFQTYPNHKMAPEAMFQHAEALFNQQKFDEAVKSYQNIYKRYPKSEYAPNSMLNEGWAYYQQKKLEKMVETFKELTVKFKESPFAGDALFSIGDYYYNKKDYMNAINYYEKLVKDFPNQSRVEEAKTLIHELSQINSYLEYEKAMAIFDNRDYPKSIEELNKVIQKYPEADVVIGAKLNIASAFEQQGDYDKAMAIFEDIMKKAENDPLLSNAAIFARQHIQYLQSKKQSSVK